MSRRAFLHPFAPPTHSSFINVVRGRGAVVWDDAGKAYIDAIASLWFANVGHGHPRMVAAIAAQAAELETYHCFAPFTSPTADALADRIAGLAPMEDPRVFFTSSGSEAIDTAIKLARVAHERNGQGQRDLVVSRDLGYHGVTMGGTSAQGIAPNQVGFGPLVPGITQLPQHDLVAMSAFFDEHGDRLAAVITEPLQAAGGVHPPRKGYLEALRELCDEHGVFLIFDEVVCGFGRLGTWFGAEHFGVTPDMMTFAKAVTSGYVPLGGVVLGRAVADPLEREEGWMLRHGHTYSGHTLACAAGLANLDITVEEGLLERVPTLARGMERGLQALVDEGLLAGHRGAGAVWAGLVHPHQDAAAVRDTLLELGVIVRPIGEALALCPPLVITDDELERVLAAMGEALRRHA